MADYTEDELEARLQAARQRNEELRRQREAATTPPPTETPTSTLPVGEIKEPSFMQRAEMFMDDPLGNAVDYVKENPVQVGVTAASLVPGMMAGRMVGSAAMFAGRPLLGWLAGETAGSLVSNTVLQGAEQGAEALGAKEDTPFSPMGMLKDVGLDVATAGAFKGTGELIGRPALNYAENVVRETAPERNLLKYTRDYGNLDSEISAIDSAKDSFDPAAFAERAKNYTTKDGTPLFASADEVRADLDPSVATSARLNKFDAETGKEINERIRELDSNLKPSTKYDIANRQVVQARIPGPPAVKDAMYDKVAKEVDSIFGKSLTVPYETLHYARQRYGEAIENLNKGVGTPEAATQREVYSTMYGLLQDHITKAAETFESTPLFDPTKQVKYVELRQRLQDAKRLVPAGEMAKAEGLTAPSNLGVNAGESLGVNPTDGGIGIAVKGIGRRFSTPEDKKTLEAIGGIQRGEGMLSAFRGAGSAFDALTQPGMLSSASNTASLYGMQVNPLSLGLSQLTGRSLDAGPQLQGVGGPTVNSVSEGLRSFFGGSEEQTPQTDELAPTNGYNPRSPYLAETLDPPTVKEERQGFAIPRTLNAVDPQGVATIIAGMLPEDQAGPVLLQWKKVVSSGNKREMATMLGALTRQYPDIPFQHGKVTGLPSEFDLGDGRARLFDPQDMTQWESIINDSPLRADEKALRVQSLRRDGTVVPMNLKMNISQPMDTQKKMPTRVETPYGTRKLE